jgi:tetratricopeptide (TPR) repeat protein
MIKPFVALSVFCIVALTYNVSAQNRKQQFDLLGESKDTAGQRMLLEKWQLADSNDAELYVAQFNYYVNKSRRELIVLGDEPEGDALQLKSIDTANKEPAGYLYGQNEYDPALLQKGFDCISKGIKKHPARLDMRFGKVYMYGVVADWANFTDEIIKTVEYSAIIKNKWLWANNKPADNAKVLMLSSVQEYQAQLYGTEDDNLMENMKSIALVVLKHYPDNVESYSNLAVVYIVLEDYDKALVELKKAEKLAPKDDIVLSNIAHVYTVTGDKENAIKYYKLVIQYGDEASKEYAEGVIESLQTK